MNRDLKIFTDNVGPNAVNQIYTLLAQPPFSNAKVRIMPDVHKGKNCVIGFTSTISDMVIPNVIGVDIGCGMLTVCLGKASLDLQALDDFIRRSIPMGCNVCKSYNDQYLNEAEKHIESLKCFNELPDTDKVFRSIGTLGGGNHFIEIDKDDEDNYYLIIHTGSRNLGVQVASHHQKKAIHFCKNAEQVKIPNELCYLRGEEKQDYLHDVMICQRFAELNRKAIAQKIVAFLGLHNTDSFETVHNYIDEYGIIRKGAISAHKGERVVIPMNMRDGCLIAVGKGNEDWNNSAPHGAGRLYNRGTAAQLFTVDEFQEQMKEVYSTSINEKTLDESPMVYKPMEEIVRLIDDTVTIQKIIKPVYNIKSSKR